MPGFTVILCFGRSATSVSISVRKYRTSRLGSASSFTTLPPLSPSALHSSFSICIEHRRTPPFAAGWLFTLFFIALPEELFFRGLLLNLLERRIGTQRALLVTSLLFGLAHFNKRAVYFNWRYVILAAVAGVFYGQAWLASRRVLTSSITHATVDTVWSIWLR